MAKKIWIPGLMLLAIAVPMMAQQGPAPTPAERPDAMRTRAELSNLLDQYPPSLRSVLGLDSTLLSNQSYLAPYPALANYLTQHPEVARNPGFYIGATNMQPSDRATKVLEIWSDIAGGTAGLIAFGMGIGLLTWVIRSAIDYRRWNKLTQVQTEIHTRLVDRFTGNDELLAYVQSPAGAKFLESAPITLEGAPRRTSAPLARILWSVQIGFVLAALGAGLQYASTRVFEDASDPLRVLGVIALALGIGFILSATISFVISQRLGLIELPSPQPRN